MHPLNIVVATIGGLIYVYCAFMLAGATGKQWFSAWMLTIHVIGVPVGLYLLVAPLNQLGPFS